MSTVMILSYGFHFYLSLSENCLSPVVSCSLRAKWFIYHFIIKCVPLADSQFIGNEYFNTRFYQVIGNIIGWQ